MSSPTYELDTWDPDLVTNQLKQRYLSGIEDLESSRDELVSPTDEDIEELNRDLENILGSLNISQNTGSPGNRSEFHPGGVVPRDTQTHLRRISLPPTMTGDQDSHSTSPEESPEESSESYSDRLPTPFQPVGSEQREDPREVTLSPMGKTIIYNIRESYYS
jgi:hypothetical protein